MHQCTFCQEPVDQATGICRRCSRNSPDNLFDQTTSVVLPRVKPDRRCPRCGEATIIGQRFCRICGLTLPSLHCQQEGQLTRLPAGSARPFHLLPGSNGSWWETSTLPNINTPPVENIAPSRVSKRRVWF